MTHPGLVVFSSFLPLHKYCGLDLLLHFLIFWLLFCSCVLYFCHCQVTLMMTGQASGDLGNPGMLITWTQMRMIVKRLVPDTMSLLLACNKKLLSWCCSVFEFCFLNDPDVKLNSNLLKIFVFCSYCLNLLPNVIGARKRARPSPKCSTPSSPTDYTCAACWRLMEFGIVWLVFVIVIRLMPVFLGTFLGTLVGFFGGWYENKKCYCTSTGKSCGILS